ncbi:MAG TPA: hypothetical protein PK239_02025 [Chitinophagales bacterium]|nr:hypothetical protein [Chitinophagales bacterium]HRK26045.1 hypothetical protein [Chitinophagales bacterium]
MQPTPKQYELIEQYVLGDLSGKQLKLVKSLIENDPVFADALHTEQIICAAIKKAKREELKTKLKMAAGKIEANMPAQQTGYTQFRIGLPNYERQETAASQKPAPNLGRARNLITNRYFKYASVAALLVIVLSVVLVVFLQQRDDTKVVSSEQIVQETAPSTDEANQMITKLESADKVVQQEKSESRAYYSEPTEKAANISVSSYRPDVTKVVAVVKKEAPAAMALPPADNPDIAANTDRLTVAVSHVETEEPMYMLGENSLLVAAQKDFLKDDFDLINLSANSQNRLYLENGPDYYPLFKTGKLTALKPETNKEIIGLLRK